MNHKAKRLRQHPQFAGMVIRTCECGATFTIEATDLGTFDCAATQSAPSRVPKDPFAGIARLG